MAELRPVKGHDLIVSDICRLFGVDPNHCKRMTIDFPVDGTVTTTFTMFPAREQLVAMKAKLEPVAGRVEMLISDGGPSISVRSAEQIRDEVKGAVDDDFKLTYAEQFMTAWGYMHVNSPTDEDSGDESDCDGPVIVEGS